MNGHKHGGKRAGAGRKVVRPEFKKDIKGVRLPAWMWAWMDEQDESRGKLLEAALIKAYKLNPPTAD